MSSDSEGTDIRASSADVHNDSDESSEGSLYAPRHEMVELDLGSDEKTADQTVLHPSHNRRNAGQVALRFHKYLLWCIFGALVSLTVLLGVFVVHFSTDHVREESLKVLLFVSGMLSMYIILVGMGGFFHCIENGLKKRGV